ncbi:MAG: TerC family protein [Elusimicrobia bacterium]|nr:TerC family protein [Candidatus Obscuribacterium magneticum]
MHPLFKWIFFTLAIVGLLLLDLLWVNKRAHEIKLREALLWSIGWIFMALLFNFGIYLYHGPEKALEFLTGYLLEKSLSVDNLFVFVLIFTYFRVDVRYQHKILFWGILGALIMRGIFILMGVTLINKFHWLIYLFGAFLVYTGIKMAFANKEEVHPEKNIALRLYKKFFPISLQNEGGRFFVKSGPRWIATPLFVVLLVVESTDVVFATDSIPAIIAITRDPFIVYTSNMFAILGLRSLYFALAGLMKTFHYLHYGLSVILTFVGVKMLISHFYKIPTLSALSVIGVLLTLSILASLLFPKEAKNLSE